MENVPVASNQADWVQGTHQPMLVYRLVLKIVHLDFLLSCAVCCTYIYRLVIKAGEPFLLVISLFRLRSRLRSLHILTSSVDYLNPIC